MVTPVGEESEAYRPDRGAQGAGVTSSGEAPGSIAAVTAAVRSSLVITLLPEPVFYSISVLDLKIVKWEPGKH